jgi:hypothetical protein
MGVRQLRNTHRKSSLVMMAIIVISFGGAALACTIPPILPGVVTQAVMISFGVLPGHMHKKTRFVDPREIMEPRLTALYTMGEMGDRSIGTVIASMHWPFDIRNHELGGSRMQASGAANGRTGGPLLR